jgi:O-antigen/teichoic acid export membrane protein
MNYSKRFSVSFLSNILKAVASALSSIFIARLLGPEDTGLYFYYFLL